ncbi:hypothetical protein [Marinifilum sp.]|uniref:hypothetical protein n=1 Tax=Marinifilum sp. TaxID=2033137 RepID=UPI003BABE6EF
MNSKCLKLLLFGIFLIGVSNSCYTGSDPEDIIEEVFSVPAEYCLVINNGINDIVMDVNAIVMNNLDTKKDTIDDEIAKCVTPVIHRTGEVIDSVVIDYGTSSNCSSNGGSFRGKIIVEPTNENLQDFDIRLSDFIANGFDVTGGFSFNIVGREAGRNFSVSTDAIKFSFSDSEETVFTFTVPSFEADYTYIRSENDDIDYVDDIYNLTSDIDITDPNGAQMSLTSESDLVYAYSCENIIGGTAFFSLQDIGEGLVNYGGGNTLDNCDGIVSVTAEGSTISVSL